MDSSAQFYATNGAILENLEDLHFFLNNCDEETYFSHVNSGKNDLVNWTRDILGERRLSNKMFKAANRDEMAVLVEGRIESSKYTGVDKKSVISKLVEAIS